MKLPAQASPAIRTNRTSRINQIIKQQSLVIPSQRDDLLQAQDEAKRRCSGLREFIPIDPGRYQDCLVRALADQGYRSGSRYYSELMFWVRSFGSWIDLGSP